MPQDSQSDLSQMDIVRTIVAERCRGDAQLEM